MMPPRPVPRVAPDADRSAEPHDGAGEWRRGWSLVLAAMLGVGFGPGLFQNLSSLFLPGLEQDFGWTRGGIATMTAVALAAGIASPWIGRFADRHGVRPLIVASMLTLGAVLLALGAGNGTKWQFQALLVVLVLTMPGCSSLVYGKLIARAFVRHRGVALAVSTSGLAVATLFMPPVIGGVIASFGWRAGFVAMAVATAVVALPLVLLALRRIDDRPTQVDAEVVADGPVVTGATASQARRDPRFWRMVLGALFINFATVGLVTQIVPLGIGRGVAPGSAALLLTAFGASQLAGRLLIGVAIDRFRPQRVATAVALVSAAAFALMSPGAPGLAAMLVLVFLAGLMNGAENDLLPFLVARLFGLRAFGEIYGSGVPFGLVGAGLGIFAFGALYDLTGDYWPALALASAALLATAWCFATLADGDLPDLSAMPPPVIAPAEGAA